MAGFVTALGIVFRKPLYVAVLLAVALALFLAATWIPNIPLLKYAYASETLSVRQLLAASPAYFTANTAGVQAAFVLLVALQGGAHAALVLFYFRRRIQKSRALGTGILGAFFGILSVGCAACGSVVLSTFLGFGVTAGILGVLPFRGIEFGVLGIILLAAASYAVARKIIDPDTCRIV